MDTFEEKLLKLKVNQHEQELSKAKLQSELREVGVGGGQRRDNFRADSLKSKLRNQWGGEGELGLNL